jgi:UPF0176 protein
MASNITIKILLFLPENYKSMFLFNRVNRDELKKRIQDDTTARKTISFYRYVIINNTQLTRDKLFFDFSQMDVLGRIYVAHEGINAQFSVPENNFEKFVDYLNSDERFKDMPLKIAVEDDGKSFYKLQIKVRNKIVADGLDDGTFDVTNVGKHLTAKEFNDAMALPNTIVVDMRNQYESEIGHFEGAITPDVDTFREELPLVVNQLEDKKDTKILLYCTGGVRCEKASAYMKHHGFTDVNQLHGGIIDYAKQVKEQGLENKFIGKNFVFDERLGETISGDVISKCHQCGNAADTHTNCANAECHLLFIQCDECKQKMKNCCSSRCVCIIELPIEEQRKLRKEHANTDDLKLYKSRLRPKIKMIEK